MDKENKKNSLFTYERFLLVVLLIIGLGSTLGISSFGGFFHSVMASFEFIVIVALHILLLVFSMKRVFKMRWLHTVLYVQLFIFFYSSYRALYIVYIEQFFFPLLLLIAISLNITTLAILLFRGKEKGKTLFVHTINGLIGLALLTKAVVLGFGGMAFGASILYFIGMATPVYVLILLYIAQVYYLKRERTKPVLIALCLAVLLLLYSIFSFFFMITSLEVYIADLLESLLH
ncbi:hypothetical protein ACTHQ4_03085 [Alkalicoccobacillus gibsonii]|uniref:hypothetical protein n=1 Tax=Alkalicoccobacillus gibsonii TaxID=79881 RepID=UPI003F7C7D7C